MVTKEVAEAVGGLKKLVPTGTSVLIEGTLAETPEGTKQVRATGRETGREEGRQGEGGREEGRQGAAATGSTVAYECSSSMRSSRSLFQQQRMQKKLAMLLAKPDV